MLIDYLTSFMLMKREHEPDGVGGTRVHLTPDRLFMGGVTTRLAEEIVPGGLSEARMRTVLVHLPGVSLHPGDVVRRVLDGMEWRVLGASDDMTAPACASGAWAQVPVERVVSAQ